MFGALIDKVRKDGSAEEFEVDGIIYRRPNFDDPSLVDERTLGAIRSMFSVLDDHQFCDCDKNFMEKVHFSTPHRNKNETLWAHQNQYDEFEDVIYDPTLTF